MGRWFILMMVAIAGIACTASDDVPLTEIEIEAQHQALKGSGAKRFMVACRGACAEATLRSAVSSHGGSHGPTIGAGRGVVTVMTDADAEALRDDGYIVELDAEVHVDGKPGPSTPPAQVTPWGVSRVGAPAAWAISRGVGVLVGVEDTGKPTHADLAGGACVNFTNERNCNDNHGHATHVTGSDAALDGEYYVVGVAPGSTTVFYKVMTRNGTGYLSWIISGADRAREDGVDVLNLSLGSSSDSTLFHQAMDDLATAGTLVVAAAGNDGPGSISYPAAYASVVSVGATTSSDAIASFSNTNADVELSAPGAGILSTSKDGGLSIMSGTSMAAPHVTGVAALVMAVRPDMDAACVRALLAETAMDLGPTGRDNAFGNGLVDADAAVAAAVAGYLCL